MPLLYFLIGIVAVLGLHALLMWCVNASPARVRRGLKWLGIGLGVAAILLFLRLGLPAISAAMAAFMGISALVLRLQQLRAAMRSNPPQPASKPMTRAQAAEILGVAVTASPTEIKAAHKRLMQKIHPDQGGTDYLASQLNQAKDVLLAPTKDAP